MSASSIEHGESSGVSDAAMRGALGRLENGEPLDRAAAEILIQARGGDLKTLLSYAKRTRDAGLEAAGRPGVITYSKKVFIPLSPALHGAVFVIVGHPRRISPLLTHDRV